MEESKSMKMITCNICGTKDVPHHKHDKKACGPCAVEYFKSIRPPLTQWTKGLTAQEKSALIKQVMKEHFEKERLYKEEAKAAQVSCKASYEEYKTSLLTAA